MTRVSGGIAGWLLCAAAIAGAQPAALVRTADYRERGLSASDFPRVTRLADGVYAFEQIDPTKRILTVNNLIVITDDGVLVADGQGTEANTRLLVAAVAKLTPKPIRYVVIGSEHGDHTGGNAAFGAVTFIAHPVSKARMKIDAETVDDRRVITLGGRDIQVLFLGRAHTGADLEVYLPGEKMLYTSEVVSNRVFPSMANAYPSEWIAALRKAEAMDVDVFVPAHGFVDAPGVLREEERAFREALERIVAEGRRLHDAHVPVEQAAARANLDGIDGWTRAANNATTAFARVYAEIEGALR
jgi:glyoxylase-like metal-dependent hydrolase (beta-lactamase superfamily II)